MQHGLRYVNKLAILYISVYTRLNFESYLKMLKPEEHWRPLDPVLHTCTTFSWLGRLFRKSFICCRVQKSCIMLSTQMHALEQAYAVHYVSDKLASTWRYQKQAINALVAHDNVFLEIYRGLPPNPCKCLLTTFGKQPLLTTVSLLQTICAKNSS